MVVSAVPKFAQVLADGFDLIFNRGCLDIARFCVQVKVLYKRKSRGYGVIVPTLD